MTDNLAPEVLAELRRLYGEYVHDNEVCAPAKRVVKTDELSAAWRALPALLDAAEERDRLRATNAALNRRCQAAESAAQQTVERVQRAGPSLGRALAGWAWAQEKRRREELEAEVARLKRGDFTEAEFQALCHHRDERPGCTRADFEAGCRAYQEQLFGLDPPEVLIDEKIGDAIAYLVLLEAILKERP